MTRRLIGLVALCVAAVPALAADPKVDSAIKVFKETQTDAAKLKAYCDMHKALDATQDDDEAFKKAENAGLKQLGPDFENAWKTYKEFDENSPDIKSMEDALEELHNKCPE